MSLQPVMGSNSKAATSSGGNYTSEVKSDSSCSSGGSANGFLFRDSDSPKKGKVSSSDGNNQEDMSSSSSVVVPRERLLPSIYDDDAQSGSPSGVFEKKDLAFQSSFKKNFPMSRDRSRYFEYFLMECVKFKIDVVIKNIFIQMFFPLMWLRFSETSAKYRNKAQ